MLTPTLEEYCRLAGEKQRVPLRKRMPADLDTPVSAFLKLRQAGAAFLLESVEQGIEKGRYSFIGIAPKADISLRDDMVSVVTGETRSSFPIDRADPFGPIREELSRSRDVLGDDLPGPFAGAVGYIAYDMVRYFEAVPRHGDSDLGLPDYRFLITGALAVFDHFKSEIEILTLPPRGEPEAAWRTASDQMDSLCSTLRSPLDISADLAPVEEESSRSSNMTKDEFCRKVLQAKEHIRDGDSFQIVLSQRFQGRTATPPFQIYRALRILNPSPYMFFIDFDDFQIVGSSPEVLVKLEKGKATLCPIAGTRPRGRSQSEDRALEEELLADEKERAEHVMLVDLGRNDLGRVCEPGTVAMESLMHVEKYSHVMHIVSQVTGSLRPGLDMYDLFGAAFPAGTLTGAPKIRAMEIISDLEEDRRGPYGGAVGYFGRQGDMDMCITIRTLIMKGEEYFAQAGAGIVADSDPEFEYRETLNKIEAIIRAIDIAEKGI